MNYMKNQRILFGLYDTSNYLRNIYEETVKRGISASYIDLSPNKYSYASNTKRYFWNTLYHNSTGNLRSIYFVLALMERIYLLLLCLIKYDVFIITGYTSFLHFFDLPILKLFKKKVIIISLGSDFRPTFLSGIYQDDIGIFDVKAEHNRFRRQQRKIRLIERYADEIVCHAPTGVLLQREFIPGQDLGIPIISKWKMTTGNEKKEKIQILHSPTRPKAKGTEYIRQAISNLNTELEFEYSELIGVPHGEVMNTLSNSHILVDEVYSDTPLGTQGLEALSNGVVVLTTGEYASYFAEDHQNTVFEKCNYEPPENLTNLIKDCIENFDEYQQNAIKLFSDINVYWDVMAVTNRLLDIVVAQDTLRRIKSETISFYGIERTLGEQNLLDFLEYDDRNGKLIPEEKLKILRNAINRKIL